MATNSLVFDFLVGRNQIPAAADKNAHAFDKLGRKTTEFGKIAAVAIGGAAVGGVLAFGAAMVRGVKDAQDYQTLNLKTAAVLKSTGNTARTSVAHIDALAASLESLSGVDETLIINSQNVLATFTRIQNSAGKGNDIFDQATKSALDLSVAMGEDLQSATVQVGKALNDPIKGLTALQRVGVSFTAAQKDQIKAMVASGNVMGAQKIILGELNKEFGGAAKAAGSGFAGSMARVKDAVWDAFRALGATLLPTLTKVADWFATVGIPNVVKFGTTIGPKLAGFITTAAASLAPFVTVLKTDLVPVVASLAGWFTGSLLPALKDMARVAFPAILGAVTAVGKAFRDNRETFGNVFSTLGTVLTKVVIPAIGQVAKILGVIAGSAAAPVIGGLAKLLSGIGGPALAAVAGIIAFKAAVSGVKTVVEGISTAIGSVKAKGGLLGALGGPWGIILGVAAGALAVWATKAADAKQHVDDLTDSIKADSGAFGENTRASIVNRLEKEGILKQAGKLGVSLSDLTEAILGNRDAAARVNEQLARYKDVQAQASSLGTKAIRPLNEQERAQHANATAAQALRDALHQETGAVNEANASARRQATALAGTTGAARTTRGAVSALTNVTVNARVRTDQWTRSVTGTQGPLRNSRGQVDLFHGALSGIPRAIRTAVTTPGLAAARAGARGLASDIAHINGRTVTVTYRADGTVLMTARSGSSVSSRIARARGGWISGPGGPTADMVPAWLSSGEYVVNARSAAAHGPLLEALNARRMAAGGRITTRYAGSFPSNPMTRFMDMYAAGWAKGKGGGGQSLGLGGSGVTRWAPTILQALRLLGQSTAWLNTVEARMSRESGGNPTIVNKWDSNWLAGHPSVGLMQVIAGTFRAYAGRFRNTGPFSYGVSVNPLANIYAGLHYAIARYGSLAALARPGGYDKGGWLPPGLSLAYNGTGRPERVLGPSHGGAPVNVTFVLDPSAHAFEDKVLSAVNTLARTRRLDYAVRAAS